MSNPLGGVWVFARYLSSPSDAALVVTEEMVFAQEIVEDGYRCRPAIGTHYPTKDGGLLV